MTDEELQRWRAVNDAKVNPSKDLCERQIRDETMKRLVSILTRNANEPETIGRRVVVLEWFLQDENSIQPLKQKDLAQRLGVTEGRVSQMLSVVEDDLATIRKEKS